MHLVSARPRGPDDYPIGDLEPHRFESLTFLLARATDPLVVPVRARDHGLDARLPDAQGRTRRGWQAKRYTGAINWEECRQSVRRALAFWRPPRITFCFPRDLSGGEQDSFRTELIEGFPEVRLDFWPGSELQRLIRDTDEGGARSHGFSRIRVQTATRCCEPWRLAASLRTPVRRPSAKP